MNSLNFKENFDIEVYEIEQYGTTKEGLKPLKFGGSSFINENVDIMSDPNNFNMIVGEGFVEYYFNVSVDEEINMVTEEEDIKNIYGTSGFAGKVIDSLPSQGADICEDEL